MVKNKIKAGDHVVFLGGTGSGKTTLGKKILLDIAIAGKGTYPIYILDTKLADDFKEYTKAGTGVLHQGNTLPPIIDPTKTGPFLVWQPEEDDPEMYDDFFKMIYQHGKPCLIFVDELSSITTAGGKPTRYYSILYKQGRAKKIGIYSCFQSAAYVPPDLFRNTMHFFRLRLGNPYDVKKIGMVMGKEAESEPIDEYGFFYRDITKPIRTSPVKYYKDMTDFF